MAVLPSDDKKLKWAWTFMAEQTVFNLATSVNNIPYCASCFYVFDEELKLLIFKSKAKTKHVTDALQQNTVAGTILPNTHDATRIRGIQFKGNFLSLDNQHAKSGGKLYYKKYPFARVIPGDIWIVELAYIKLTDSRLGIGNRYEWKKTE
jgi:uncharacterized protein YhbP (UPF0306 family)